MRHNLIDPYTPGQGYYECRACTHREASVARVTTCSACGAAVRNLAVPRE